MRVFRSFLNLLQSVYERVSAGRLHVGLFQATNQACMEECQYHCQ